MISARFFTERGNVCAGYRGAMVNLWVRVMMGAERLDCAEGAEDGELRGRAATPLAIARAVGLLEELGRDGAATFVEDGLREAVDAGLLEWDPAARIIRIADWDIWGTNPAEVRRRRDRERKRRKRAVRGTSADNEQMSADVPRTGEAEIKSVRGQDAETPDTSADHDLDPEDPVDRQDQDQDPLTPEGDISGALTAAVKKQIAERVDEKAPARLRDNWFRELRNLMQAPHFDAQVKFIRWYGEHLKEQGLVVSAGPHKRILSTRGVKALRKLKDRLEDYDGNWEALRKHLFVAAHGLTSNPHNRGDKPGSGGPWIELADHLLRDDAQFNRHFKSGENATQRDLGGVIRRDDQAPPNWGGDE